ncbi:succinylglutamate-semialdehyde dehydrogenase [Parasphingorhabdus sp. JC815]|uniref:succinylglutamate-semialdehyde dehydrogenase n=1 Tax=Parasphingorhabdus sp. JC815 TaxID=3232140 RepID=UPI003459CC69
MTELISTEPATGEILWRGEAGDADAAVANARAAWPSWAALPVMKRIEVVRRYANRVRQHADEFAELISRETGKPIWESHTEVESVIKKVDISVTAFAERTPQRKLSSPADMRAALRHKPHGVLAVLGPYNFPAHLPNGHIVPALIAGNTIVFKPSEKTPAVGQFLFDILQKSGVPDGVFNILQGGPDTGKNLAANDDIDGLLFTGSAQTGVALNRQFASRPDKILALEMGGNNPIIVWDTGDIHSAAVLVVQSAFLTAGQRCSAASRMIVKDSLYDRVVREVKRIADRLIIDGPFSTPAPFMGPVIDNDVADGLTESFLALMSHGGRPVKHMARPIENRPFLTPGIIDVTSMAERPDIELFGPILQIIRVSNFEEAIAEANNTRYGLSAALIGGSADQFNQFWSHSRAGIVNWNKMTVGASSEAPFGGVGLSGNHRPSAYYAADYCAYPVVSMEADQAKASIGIGLKDEDSGDAEDEASSAGQ